jgi:hypothetical protein
MWETYISYFHKQPIVCLSVVSTLFPLALILYKKAYSQPTFLILFIYLVVKFAVDNVMLYYALFKVNTVLYFNINVLIRYVLLSAMFYYNLETVRYRKAILYSILAFLVFWVVDFLYCNPELANLHHHRALLYSTTLECLLMIFWILLYFYETIRTLKIPNLLTAPFFWICSGFLLYYSSFVFIAPVLNSVFKWDKRLDIGFLLDIPSIFEIVCMILISVGTWFFSSNDYARQ